LAARAGLNKVMLHYCRPEINQVRLAPALARTPVA
jgi:hypothetical protein